jgi:SAM-dependent methyltransferase
MTPKIAKEWANAHGLALRYDAALEALKGLNVAFTQLGVDGQTAEYIAQAEGARHGLLTTWLHRALRLFLSDFDINGLLGTYPMHVLSTEQWRTLLKQASPEGVTHKRLLDVGAGRGDATKLLAELFTEVTVTETSRTMAKRLRRQGFRCIEADITESMKEGEIFDVVSLLNVLDRCDRPLSLLAKARTLLNHGGLLIVALVLPYGPFVYDGGQPRPPRERLPITLKGWEQASVEFITSALLPLGFTLRAMSRAPYLSGGDARRTLYELDDLIVILEATGDIPVLSNAPPDVEP